MTELGSRPALTPGQRAAGIVADLGRLGALLSVVAAAVWYGPAEVVRFVIVFLGVLVPRVAKLPRPFDAALCVTLLLAAWSGVAHWYAAVAWWDLLVHGVTTAGVAAAAYLALARIEIVDDLQSERLRQHRYAVVVPTFAVGVTVGVLWEFWEWIANRYLVGSIHVGYDDTIGDLAMDSVGSLIAGLGLVAWARAGWGTRRRDAGHHRGRDRDR